MCTYFQNVCAVYSVSLVERIIIIILIVIIIRMMMIRQIYVYFYGELGNRKTHYLYI